MSCLAPHDLARAATIDVLPPHVHDCLDCRRALDQQRAMLRALQTLPTPSLSDARRRALKAETLAEIGQRGRKPETLAPLAERRTMRHGWRWTVGAIAAAALAFVVLRSHGPAATQAIGAPAMSSERIAFVERDVARDDVPPPLRTPAIDAGVGAVLMHTPGTARDAVALADGTIDIDTRGARDVDVRIGRTVVRVDDARVKIRARGHAVISVEVVVGSARIIGPDKQVTLERDTVWTAAPRVASASLTAFRDAWIALRSGRAREAIALFDRATDTTVAEEASYWAAVAAMRAGDLADAQQRFADFLSRFPASPYADKARSALHVR
ncbi:MAG: hypothetical protein JO257_21410 [Deltaproteobacteria bacterium]|nr:hypothetical protein [Deltaproteobacteria bacterium]